MQLVLPSCSQCLQSHFAYTQWPSQLPMSLEHSSVHLKHRQTPPLFVLHHKQIAFAPIQPQPLSPWLTLLKQLSPTQHYLGLHQQRFAPL
jgi:hypothetical protein